MKFTVRK